MAQFLFPPENSPPLILRRRHGIRAILLGSAAVLALALPTGPGGTAALADAANGQTATAVAPTSFADVVEHVRGAVVAVKLKTTETADMGEEFDFPQIVPGDPLERFFKHFREEGGGHKHARPHLTQAQGSGFIISSDGYVVTNYHVVENATDVSVTMDDGKDLPATKIGRASCRERVEIREQAEARREDMHSRREKRGHK